MTTSSFGWFGEPWPTHDGSGTACDPANEVPTPAGAPCFGCRLAILDGDSGMVLPRGAGGVEDPFHLSCIRDVLAHRETAEVYLDSEFRTSLEQARNGETIPYAPPRFIDGGKPTAEEYRAALRACGPEGENPS